MTDKRIIKRGKYRAVAMQQSIKHISRRYRINFSHQSHFKLIMLDMQYVKTSSSFAKMNANEVRSKIFVIWNTFRQRCDICDICKYIFAYIRIQLLISFNAK